MADIRFNDVTACEPKAEQSAARVVSAELQAPAAYVPSEVVNLKQRLKRVEEMPVIEAEPLLSNQVEHHAEPRDAAGNR